jgi:hypothetical protein
MPTNTFGAPYIYAGQQINIHNDLLSAEQHAGVYQAAGLPAPPYDPARYVTIEPPDPQSTARACQYLRERKIGHECETAVAYNPDSDVARDLDDLLGRLAKAPVFPGQLEQQALEAAAGDASAPADARAAIEVLLAHRRAGKIALAIDDAQLREADTQALVARGGAQRRRARRSRARHRHRRPVADQQRRHRGADSAPRDAQLAPRRARADHGRGRLTASERAPCPNRRSR